ncbi:MAG: response regulator [Myxococcota bacterium]
MGAGDERTEEERDLMVREVERVAGIGSYVWEPGRRVRWSPGLFLLLGYEPGSTEPSAESFFARVHPDDRARVVAAWSSAPVVQQITPIEYRIVRPSGEERWVRGNGVWQRDERGGVARFAGVLIDITEQRRSEARTVLALRLLQESQRVGGIGSFVVDLATGEIDWSPGLRVLQGLPPDVKPSAELGRSLMQEPHRSRNEAWFHRAAAGEAVPPLHSRMVGADGRERIIESHAARITLDVDGHPRVIGTVIDVSERTRLEEKLREAAKVEALGNLAAGVAHDVNNYLLVIHGNLQLAVELEGAAQQEMLAQAAHATEQCALLTQRLLAFARRQPASARVTDLVALARDTARLLQRVVGPHIEVVLEVEGGGHHVRADPGHLESAVVNLAVNARDAMPQGGRLTLRVHGHDVAEGGPVPAGGYVALAVRDTGAGIPPELLPRIFDPYFTTKGPGEGTGLGLASVYGTVRQNEGHVLVDSVVGAGTTFTILLPRVAAEPVSRDLPALPAPCAERVAGTVLVAEDVDAVRSLTARILRQAGYVVREAADGATALRLLDQGPGAVDVLLTDVLMPGMDGVALAREVRARAPGLPVVFMTGYADQRLPADPGGRGKAVTLHKPFSPAELLAAVGSALAALGDAPARP